ncbi:MAG: protein kinase [Sandaracinus sp.]|nr:protein kinase [Sandaracinus sp.]
MERTVHWLDQLLGALAEAHAHGLVHRDVKPANIMTCRQGGALDVAKLLDFGLVAERGVSESGGPRRIFGTPLYLAPEAIARPNEVDPRADLYAVGATGFELLTGRPPFDFADASTALKHQPRRTTARSVLAAPLHPDRARAMGASTSREGPTPPLQRRGVRARGTSRHRDRALGSVGGSSVVGHARPRASGRSHARVGGDPRCLRRRCLSRLKRLPRERTRSPRRVFERGWPHVA